LVDTCLTYKDIFYLPGDKLISTSETMHSINLELGSEMICTKPYRLPKTKKVSGRKTERKGNY